MNKVRPSEIMHIPDEYTAYCFDEACMYIRIKMEKDEEPHFEQVGNDNSKPHFRSPSEMYKSMGYGLREYVKVKP